MSEFLWENIWENHINNTMQKHSIPDISDDVNELLVNPEVQKFEWLVKLSSNLGLTETIEMLELREEIIDLLCEWVSVKHKKIEYEEIAMWLIDKYHWEEYYRAQIALSILNAAMYLISWKMDIYSEEVEDIITYASNMWYEDIVQEIQKLK